MHKIIFHDPHMKEYPTQTQHDAIVDSLKTIAYGSYGGKRRQTGELERPERILEELLNNIETAPINRASMNAWCAQFLLHFLASKNPGYLSNSIALFEDPRLIPYLKEEILVAYNYSLEWYQNLPNKDPKWRNQVRGWIQKKIQDVTRVL